MTAKVQFKMEMLNGMNPLTFVEDELIRSRFIDLFLKVNPDASDENAEEFYSKQSIYFRQLVAANPELKQCTLFSLYGSFLEIILNGLSYDPSSKLIYLLSRNVNIAAKGQQDQWEKRAYNVISPYGELALRIKAKQILYVDDPVIVYENDVWEPGYDQNGRRYCLYQMRLPHVGKPIIGSFIKIYRTDGSHDFPFFTDDNFNEWKKASEKQNRGKASSLYGNENTAVSIGFMKAKTIKHAFKTYPKIVVLGSNTQLEDDETIPGSGAAEITAPTPPTQPSPQTNTAPPVTSSPEPVNVESSENFASPEPQETSEGLVFQDDENFLD